MNTLEGFIDSEEKLIKGQTKCKRKRKRKQGPLTPKQVEAVVAVIDCDFNISKASRLLGKDRKTIKQHYDSALKKFGLNPTNLKKEIIKMQKLPEDSDGQVYLASETERLRHRQLRIREIF